MGVCNWQQRGLFSDAALEAYFVTLGGYVPSRPQALGEGTVGMELVGNALHGFLAVDRTTLTASQRKDLANGLLVRWNVESSVDADAVLSAGDALRGWVESKWPGAKWHREWPLRMKLKSGSTLRGTADLVLETSAGYVVIDHKSFPSGRDKAIEKAASYAGQVLAYAEAIHTATGKPVIGNFIHLPVLGLVVPIKIAAPKL